jgi:hypothetical protein
MVRGTGTIVSFTDDTGFNGIAYSTTTGRLGSFGFTTNQDLSLASKGSGSVKLITNDTEVFTINSSGNVGINKTPDATYKLDVNGSLNATNVLINGNPISGSSKCFNSGIVNRMAQANWTRLFCQEFCLQSERGQPLRKLSFL